MIVKLSPFMSPFAPPAEPGVYWLGLEHQGYALHDGHVIARIEHRRAFWSGAVNTTSCAPGVGQVNHMLCSGFVEDPAFLNALAVDGIRAAGRRRDSLERRL